MALRISSNKKGLSLVEVLIATGVISVAVYGMILVMGSQEIAEARIREARVVKYLQTQLVREVVKGERGPRGLWGNSLELYNPALGNSTSVWYRDSLTNATLKTQVEWRGSAATSRKNNYTVLYPFNGGNYQP